MTTFEEEYLDVLQNIEAAIVGAYRGNGELTDYEVDKALNGLWMEYRAEQAGKTAGPVNMNERVQQVYSAVKIMCEWRLGRAAFDDGREIKLEPKTADEIMACLKRIRKSVDFWTKKGGRQGYLTFIDENGGM